jgi:hypothetical protein
MVFILNKQQQGSIMTKVKAIADKFFNGDVENLLTEMAGVGFKVDGWSATTELPLNKEDFRAKMFVALKRSGVTEAKFAAAMSAWNVQTIDTEQLNSVAPGAIEKIEDAVVDAIAVQNAGLQQLGEVHLEQQVSEARNSGVTDGIVLELARLEGEFDSRLRVREILSQVNSSMHTNQKNKALSIADNLLKKIQASYSKSNDSNQTAKNNQENTDNVVASIFQRLAGINNSVPGSAEGK